MPSSVFGASFFNDSTEDLNQLSPGFRPGSSQEDMGAFAGEDRRPSIASATTVSSNNSKSSVGRQFQKKLHGFFGEDFPGLENVKHGSESSTGVATPQNNSSGGVAIQKQRNRNNSTQNNHLDISRPISPSSFSRPQTPSHSNEVTPWEFQDATGNNKVGTFLFMSRVMTSRHHVSASTCLTSKW
jgi:adenylate cyclase